MKFQRLNLIFGIMLMAGIVLGLISNIAGFEVEPFIWIFFGMLIMVVVIEPLMEKIDEM